MEKAKKKLSFADIKEQYRAYMSDTQFANDRKRWASNIKKFILGLFKLVIIVGICYVILGPVIGIISSSFFSNEDYYNTLRENCKDEKDNILSVEDYAEILIREYEKLNAR